MAVGAIKKRPVVIETDQGDSIAIRHMMYLSLSYDHRIIDGSLGSTFFKCSGKRIGELGCKPKFLNAFYIIIGNNLSKVIAFLLLRF